MALALDPALLRLAFTVSTILVACSVTLAGLVRGRRRMRGAMIHALTMAHGAIALVVLLLLALGAEIGLGLFIGIVAGLGAGCFWLIGALVTRGRPAWADLVVIASVLLCLTTYALIGEDARAGAAVILGQGQPAPEAPP